MFDTPEFRVARLKRRADTRTGRCLASVCVRMHTELLSAGINDDGNGFIRPRCPKGAYCKPSASVVSSVAAESSLLSSHDIAPANPLRLM